MGGQPRSRANPSFECSHTNLGRAWLHDGQEVRVKQVVTWWILDNHYSWSAVQGIIIMELGFSPASHAPGQMFYFKHEGSSALPCCGWGIAGGRARPCACLCKCLAFDYFYGTTVNGRCFVVSSEDAVGVELPSVIRQLESFFRSFLRILDLTWRLSFCWLRKEYAVCCSRQCLRLA